MEKQEKTDFCTFLRLAHEEYVSRRVSSKECTYHRFYNDFLNGHKHAAWGMDANEHERIMGSLTDLLKHREALVRHYFEHTVLTDADYKELEKAHNSTATGKHLIELEARRKSALTPARQKRIRELTTISLNLNETQLTDIADWFCMEENGIAYLQDVMLTAADIKLFLAGNMSLRIKPNMNQLFMIKLDAMQQAGLIDEDWRGFLEYHKSLIGAKHQQPLVAKSMYRSLSGGKAKYPHLFGTFFDVTKEIKDRGQVNSLQK